MARSRHLLAGGGGVHGSLGTQELWSASNLGNLVWNFDPAGVGRSRWRQERRRQGARMGLGTGMEK